MKYIWARSRGDLARWDTVHPVLLNSDQITPDDLEEVALRYRQRYPKDEFVVAESKPADPSICGLSLSCIC